MSDLEPGLLPGPRPLRPPLGAGPLHGLTVAIKDLFDVAGFVTGEGNPVWAAESSPASADADVVAKLHEAGATLWAKAVTDEFAYSLDGDNAHFEVPANTRAPGRLPGGSSSGPAAAVAAGLVDIGLGSDTAGSIRVPAAYCGLYGYRPTHGAISTAGVARFVPSFDTVGLMTATFEVMWSAATVIGAVGGEPPAQPPRFIVPAFLANVADSPVRDRCAAVAAELDSAGHSVEVWADTSDELTPQSLTQSYLVLSRIEAWESYGEWVSRHWTDLTPEVADRFRAASQVDPAGAAVRQARAHRGRLRQYLAERLDPDGFLVLPAAATEPIEVGASAAVRSRTREATIALCTLAGLTGAPAIVVPGAAADELPIGICLVGSPGRDRSVFAAARVVDDVIRASMRRHRFGRLSGRRSIRE